MTFLHAPAITAIPTCTHASENYLHTRPHTYRKYMHPLQRCMRACTHTFKHACIHACMHASHYTNTRIHCMHACVITHMHLMHARAVCIHTCCTHAYIATRTARDATCIKHVHALQHVYSWMHTYYTCIHAYTRITYLQHTTPFDMALHQIHTCISYMHRM